MATLELRNYDNKNGGGCRVYVNGVCDRKLTASGCGYDREGAAFGNYLQEYYQERLLQVFGDDKPAKIDGLHYHENEPLPYGMYKTTKNNIPIIFLDGACGFSLMRNIAKAIGLHIERLLVKSRNSNYYRVEVENENRNS